MNLEHRSFSLRNLKADERKPGQFSGKASVYGVLDSYSDIVMPGAFAKTLAKNGNRIKVLNQHDPSDVIGMATLQDSADALLATGQLELALPSASQAYTRLKAGLIDGISIGYVTKGESRDKAGNRLLTEIDLWEISLVTFPANEDARVTSVKSRRADGDITELFTLHRIALALRSCIAIGQAEATVKALQQEIRATDRKLSRLEARVSREW